MDDDDEVGTPYGTLVVYPPTDTGGGPSHDEGKLNDDDG